ncbi:MAG: MOSC domain-containing protein [Pseudomonadales bacterium]
MRLAEIHRYPVKSMQGERLMQTRLLELGIPGDRAWALRDEARGGLTGAKHLPGLMGMRARFAREPDTERRSPEVHISVGGDAPGSLSSASGDVDQMLSRALDHPVSLWPLLPAEQVEHYRREALPDGVDLQDALRALFGRTEDEPLPDVSQFPEVLATHHTPPGTYFDAFPLLIVTRSSLQALATAAAGAGIDANFDQRRFRPNLVVEADLDGFVENAWVGRRLCLGEATLKVEMACPRCVMTTHGFDDIPREPGVMRALVRHNDGNLGVYASVLEGGVIRAGDAVEVL